MGNQDHYVCTNCGKDWGPGHLPSLLEGTTGMRCDECGIDEVGICDQCPAATVYEPIVDGIGKVIDNRKDGE